MSHLQTIAEHLTSRRQTVTCAESCTGGLLAGALTSVPGSSQWFHQSFVTYSNQAKQDRLGVMPDTLLNTERSAARPSMKWHAAQRPSRRQITP